MATSVRISISDDTERVLERLKRDYPTLDYPELFKLGLSELYRKQELEARKRWAESLLELELTDAERRELAEALKEGDEEIRREARVMSIDDIMAEALSD